MPTSSSNAYIVDGGTATITLSGAACSNLSLGGSGSGTLQIIAGGLTASNVYAGNGNSTGALVQSGGSMSLSSYLYLGYDPGALGTYSLNGTGQLTGGGFADEYVGYSGTGTFTQTGGNNSIGTWGALYLGYTSSSSGNYTLSSNGQLSVNVAQVGYSGTGTFTQQGGSNGSSHLYLGSNSGGSGTYTLSGSGQLSSENQYVGNSGTGNFTQSGGTNNAGILSENGGLNLGQNAGSNGTYTLYGSGVLVAVNYESIGVSGSGYFSQTGGANHMDDDTGSNLTIGGQSGGIGTYSLGGSGLLSATFEYVGYSGRGSLLQTGGTNDASASGFVTYIYLGYNAGSSGVYSLSGKGRVYAEEEFIGSSGTGAFTQSGGTNQLTSYNVYLGYNAGGGGTYTLTSSGLLSAGSCSEYLGYSGTGTFTQSGGSNTTSSLYLGYNAGSSGAYNLSASGSLTASNEYVGYNSAATALFQQSGGVNKTSNLFVGSGGTLQFTGGTIQLGGGLLNQGVVDGGGGPGVLIASGTAIVDFSQGILENTGSMSLSVGPNSLLVVPAGFNTSTGFGSLTCGSLSLIHTAGTTLTVPAGIAFGGQGSISDPVNCQGAISAVGAINLNNGLVLAGTGNVNLGSGNLTVNDTASGITGGQLSVATHYVGYSGTGVFTQSGGIYSAGVNYGSGIFLGYNAGDNGTYSLSGSGQLYAGSMYIGYSGRGNFQQAGGSNSTSSYLELGVAAGSNGNCTLSGGQVYSGYLIVGSYGTGTFTQTGGVNTLNFYLRLGYYPGSSGSYSLSGSGLLAGASADELVGYDGTGVFMQSGGTNAAGSLSIYSSGSYTLSGSGQVSTPTENVYGLFTQSGGLNAVSGVLTIGGSYNLNGGLLTLAGLTTNAGNGTLNFNGGTLQASGSFSTSVPMTLAASGSGATFDTAGNAVTLSGQLSGSGSLTKLGNGALTLATTNTYSGNTLISGGTLALGNAWALQQSTLNASGGALTFASPTAATLGGLSGPGAISLTNASSAAVALSVGNDSASTTYSGTLKGPGSLKKIGSGLLCLTSPSTYAGGTTISGGSLQITNGGALGFGAVYGPNVPMRSTAASSGGLLDLDGSTLDEPLTLNGGGLINSNTASAATLSNGVAGLSFSGTGSGFSGGTTVTVSGGTGSGAGANASLGLTGASFTLSGGTGYKKNEVLTVTGGGGSGATLTITGTTTHGVISTWTLTTPGSGYTSAPTGVTGANGSGASLSGNNTNFQLRSLTSTAAGSGYTAAPTVSFTSGSGVTATAVLSSLTLAGTANQIGGDGNLTRQPGDWRQRRLQQDRPGHADPLRLE